ncbi:uncharacterized protein L3040_001403 [Drepanopeziza brunnea f. sp. 'multigermtubi']|uniref:uncharacterized protein n=1 Tax=Drepanopeziza brunnea f. sp. 'multigermtubi' TaxID=698441 RepID=UPI00239BD12B|nr:hypothetical protein L3040_001403 [Drepanopeziza brunnea f. sp. 'multigermtubi']
MSKGGKGRIFRANIEIPRGQDASNRSDIELLFPGLPEQIDLEIDEDSQTLFWTDRGAIGLKLYQVNKHIYLTDLGGAVYRIGMDGKNKKKIYDEEAAFSGSGLAHV